MTPFNGGGPEKAESAEQQNDAGVEAAAEGLRWETNTRSLTENRRKI